MGIFLRAGKVSMRANCVSLLTGSCVVIRARPRPSGCATRCGGRCEAQPARKCTKGQRLPLPGGGARKAREVRDAAYGLRGRKVDVEIFGGNYGFVYHNLWLCVIMDRKTEVMEV